MSTVGVLARRDPEGTRTCVRILSNEVEAAWCLLSVVGLPTRVKLLKRSRHGVLYTEVPSEASGVDRLGIEMEWLGAARSTAARVAVQNHRYRPTLSPRRRSRGRWVSPTAKNIVGAVQLTTTLNRKRRVTVTFP
eukprot:1466665-Rhodomonas_salina.3